MLLHTFQANVASSLVTAKKRTRGGPSAESKLTNRPYKLVQVQSTPMLDIRLDGINQMRNWNKERESVVSNVLMATHMFSVVNAIPGFVSIKIETVLKVIMDIRMMLHMFKTKLILFKVNNRNTRTRCKICSKLSIKSPR